jgi:hypothetical protein
MVPERGVGSSHWLIAGPGLGHRVSGWGGCRRSRAPAARPCAGWRSSSPLRSGGAGTTGTGAVRGRTRRPTSPAAAWGEAQRGRGRGWPWLPYRARAGRLAVADLVSDDSGTLRSPWWLGRAVPGCLPGIQVAGSTLGSGGGGHHAQPPTRQPTRWPARIRTPRVPAGGATSAPTRAGCCCRFRPPVRVGPGRGAAETLTVADV